MPGLASVRRTHGRCSTPMRSTSQFGSCGAHCCMAADCIAQQELSLRLVIFGGEALNFAELKPWFERHGDAHPQLVNMYGITETTVHVTYRPVRLSDVDSATSAIGRPIP